MQGSKIANNIRAAHAPAASLGADGTESPTRSDRFVERRRRSSEKTISLFDLTRMQWPLSPPYRDWATFFLVYYEPNSSGRLPGPAAASSRRKVPAELSPAPVPGERPVPARYE
ncbi:Hypothetical protein NTJ_05117 [Nesidiocoris tenuis]|uniref:Uncharacterized protein n=1 Tax=Nesidiocoris tenuis TaxID=355587 RepID=A0ABN7AM50_9HEMI|nr:Hypothetical protein NTJ_05117 [Nesidiocoris tenuis]